MNYKVYLYEFKNLSKLKIKIDKNLSFNSKLKEMDMNSKGLCI